MLRETAWSASGSGLSELNKTARLSEGNFKGMQA